jgi:hypothetical protein
MDTPSSRTRVLLFPKLEHNTEIGPAGPFSFLVYLYQLIAMKKFLQFVSAADDAATFPADSLQSMVCDADGVVKMRFYPSILGTANTASDVDLVTLTITSDQETAVMESISKEIAFGKDAFISVCNDVTSENLHVDIVSCVITLDS